MTFRNISVKLTADVSGFTASMGAASASAKRLGSDISSTLTSTNKETQRALEKASRGALVVGGSMLAGVGLATKAAIDFESAFAGVTKTVDGSSQQLGELREGILAMAREMPASASEIAAVAESAGQLGIQRDSILAFSKVMIDLGETTNLSAEQAATSLAQLANVMGTSSDDYGRLGAAIVELGNDGASTEAQIVELAQRLAGAGKSIGLSEANVLSFASALSSVGLDAEAAGTAFSRVFITMGDAVANGGQKLDTFARVSGETSTQFRQAFQADAASAIASFVEGLGRMTANGDSLTGVLGDLELGEIRVSDALRRTAGSGDLLNRTLATGNRAWEENSALAEEAAKRYGTTAAQMKILHNNVNDVAIGIGTSLLPIVGSSVEVLGGLVRTVQDLPGPLSGVIGGIGGITGATLTAAGAIGAIIPKIQQGRAELEKLGVAGQAASRGIGGIGKAAGLVALLGGIAFAFETASSVLDKSADKMVKRFQELSKLAGRELVEGFDDATEAVKTHGSAVDRAGQALGEVWKGPIGVLGLAKERYRDLTDEAHRQEVVFKELASSNIGRAQAVIAALSAEGRETAHLQAILDDVVGTTKALNADQQRSTEILGGTTAAMGEVADAGGEAARGISELSSAIEGFIDPMAAYQDAVEAVADAERSAAQDRERTATDSLEAEAKKLDDRAQLQARALDDEKTAVQRRQAAERDGLERGKRESSAAFEARRAELQVRQRVEDEALDDRRTSMSRGVEDEKAKLAERTEAVRTAAAQEREAEEERAKAAELSVTSTLDAWQAQVDALMAWQANVLKIAAGGHDGVADYLASLGPDAAPLVEKFAGATEEEFARLETQLPYLTGSATDGIRRKLEEAGPVLAWVAAAAGQQTADAFADALARGQVRVEDIAAQYGAAFATVGPLLQVAVGTPDSGRVRVMASGGVVNRRTSSAAVLRNPTIVAGEGRGSESYIPHHPAYRSTAVPVLHQTAQALGFRAVPMETGGWVGPGISAASGAGSIDYDRLAGTLARHAGVTFAPTYEVHAPDTPSDVTLEAVARRSEWRLSLTSMDN